MLFGTVCQVVQLGEGKVALYDLYISVHAYCDRGSVLSVYFRYCG